MVTGRPILCPGWRPLFLRCRPCQGSVACQTLTRPCAALPHQTLECCCSLAVPLPMPRLLGCGEPRFRGCHRSVSWAPISLQGSPPLRLLLPICPSAICFCASCMPGVRPYRACRSPRLCWPVLPLSGWHTRHGRAGGPPPPLFPAHCLPQPWVCVSWAIQCSDFSTWLTRSLGALPKVSGGGLLLWAPGVRRAPRGQVPLAPTG